MLHVVPALLLLACAMPAAAIAAAGDDQPSVLAAAATAKERLSDKGSDEQRVDDCKVPPAQRTRARPAECGFR
jgi:hypothetical protein